MKKMKGCYCENVIYVNNFQIIVYAYEHIVVTNVLTWNKVDIKHGNSRVSRWIFIKDNMENTEETQFMEEVRFTCVGSHHECMWTSKWICYESFI